MTETPPPFSRYRRPLMWSLIIGIAIYGLAVILMEPGAILAAVRSLDPRLLVFIALLLALNYGLRFARWQFYLRRLGYRVEPGRSLACYLGAFAFTTTPGKAGEAVRSVYLKRDGVRYVDSLAALFTERLLDVLALVMLSALVVLSFAAARWTIAGTTLLVVAVIIVIHHRRLHAAARAWLAGRAGGRLSRAAIHFIDLLEAASRLLSLPRLAVGLGLGSVAWLAEGVIFFLILASMSVDVSLSFAVGLWAVSMLVGALSFLPGGLGATEATMGSLLVLAGVDGPTAVAATLTYRICTLWVAVALGLLIITRLELHESGTNPIGAGNSRDLGPERDLQARGGCDSEH